jgi:hypothetical protein
MSTYRRLIALAVVVAAGAALPAFAADDAARNASTGASWRHPLPLDEAQMQALSAPGPTWHPDQNRIDALANPTPAKAERSPLGRAGSETAAAVGSNEQPSGSMAPSASTTY